MVVVGGVWGGGEGEHSVVPPPPTSLEMSTAEGPLSVSSLAQASTQAGHTVTLDTSTAPPSYHAFNLLN